MTSRKQPGVAFWATVVVVVAMVAYPLSFGPACWLNERGFLGAAPVSALYSPVLATAENGRLPKIIDRYARLGARPDDFPYIINKMITWKSAWDNPQRRRTKLYHAPQTNGRSHRHPSTVIRMRFHIG
jgi:hypothetical protein